jgi:hypothetical protein
VVGSEAFIPGSAADVYLYDFTSAHWSYTSSTLFLTLDVFKRRIGLPPPPKTKKQAHYTTNPRSFANLTTGQIFDM